MIARRHMAARRLVHKLRFCIKVWTGLSLGSEALCWTEGDWGKTDLGGRAVVLCWYSHMEECYIRQNSSVENRGGHGACVSVTLWLSC